MAKKTTKQSTAAGSLWHNKKALQGLLVVALLFTGTATAVAWQSKNEVRSRQTVIEDNLQLPENLSDVLSLEQIRQTATADIPSGAAISQVELENEEGTLVYKVKFSDGSFRLYNARTGAAFVKSEAAEVDASVPADFVAGITLQQARDIAVSNRPGQTVTKIELETEEGVVVYSVRFADDSRVDVNALDGSIVRVRTPETSNPGSGSSGSGSTDDDSNDSDDDRSGRRGGSDDDSNDSDDDRSGSNSGSASSGSNSGSGSDD